MEQKITKSKLTLLYEVEGIYIGNHSPTESLKPPDIITEPLSHVYTASLYRQYKTVSVSYQHVLIRVFNCGIIIQDSRGKRLQWFPIQNLYCSACLRPDMKDKNGAEVLFKTFTESLSRKGEKRQAIFAMVMRDIESKKKLLKCHAYVLQIPSFAKVLVEATQKAYIDKSGWNHPICDSDFVMERNQMVLEALTTDDPEEQYEHYEIIKEFSDSREDALQKKPTTIKAVSMKHKNLSKRPPIRRAITSHSAPTTPRLYRDRPSSGHSTAVVSRQMYRPMAVVYPTSESQTYTWHQQPQQQMMITKSASITGFPISRSSSKTTNSSYQLQGSINGPDPWGDFYSLEKKGRKPKRQVSSRSHRVLASSEPQDTVNHNGHLLQNGGPSISKRRSAAEATKDIPIVDWSELPNGMLNGGLNGNTSRGHPPAENGYAASPKGETTKAQQPIITSSKGRVKKKYDIVNSDKLNLPSKGFLARHSAADQPL